MKVGFLTCALNFDEAIEDNKPVRNLRDSLRARGHDVIHLDTEQAQWNGNDIVYPNLKQGESVDMFIGFYPGDSTSIPYFEQLKYLDSKFPSPAPYRAQVTARDKTALIGVFEKASLPIPRSFNGNDMQAREIVLNDIRNHGRTIVMKPDFGGSGHGIVRVNSEEDAQAAFKNFDARHEPFMMQDYIETGGTDYRAYVVGDQVLAGISRTAQNGQWKTNVALGSVVGPYEFTDAQKRDAVTAIKAAHLDFGAVDILIDRRTGQHYICEVNDACSGTESIDTSHKNMRVSEHVANMLVRKFDRA